MALYSEIMNETSPETVGSGVGVLSAKDRLIREQAKRIEHLESEVEKVCLERDRLSTKVTLLSYKLHLNKSSKPSSLPR